MSCRFDPIYASLTQRYQEQMMHKHSPTSPISKRFIDNEAIAHLNARFSGLAYRELLEFVLNEEGVGKAAVVSSFGAESAVLLHMIAISAPQTPILFVDTGKLFPQTLEYQKRLAAKLKLTNVEILRPERNAVARKDPQGTLWNSYNTACCDLRKVLPLHLGLAQYDTWISGRKSYQSELRAPLEHFERSGNHIKVNPLANWSHRQLTQYIERHDLPRHPLVDQGYASIGCASCTTPISDGEHPRAGRWRHLNKTECGIHFVNDKAVPQQQQSL